MADGQLNIKHAVYGKFGGERSYNYEAWVKSSDWSKEDTDRCNSRLLSANISSLYRTINDKIIVENPEHPIETIFKEGNNYIFTRCFPPTFRDKQTYAVDGIFHAIAISEKDLASINYDISKIRSNFIQAYNEDSIIGPDGGTWLGVSDLVKARPIVKDISISAENIGVQATEIKRAPMKEKISVLNSNDPFELINNLPLPQKIFVLNSNVITNLPGNKLFVLNPDAAKLVAQEPPASLLQEHIVFYRSHSTGFVFYNGEPIEAELSNKFKQIKLDELQQLQVPEAMIAAASALGTAKKVVDVQQVAPAKLEQTLNLVTQTDEPKLPGLSEILKAQPFFKNGERIESTGTKLSVKLAENFIPDNTDIELFIKNLAALQEQFAGSNRVKTPVLNFVGGPFGSRNTIFIPKDFPLERLDELNHALENFGNLAAMKETTVPLIKSLIAEREPVAPEPKEIPVILDVEGKTAEIKNKFGIYVKKDNENSIRFNADNGTITVDLDKIYAGHSVEGHPEDLLLAKDKVAIEEALRKISGNITISSDRTLVIPADVDITEVSKALRDALIPKTFAPTAVQKSENNKKTKQLRIKKTIQTEKKKLEDIKLIELKKHFEDKQAQREKIREILEYIDNVVLKKDAGISFLGDGIHIGFQEGFSTHIGALDTNSFLANNKSVMAARLAKASKQQNFKSNAVKVVDELNIIVPYNYDFKMLGEALEITPKAVVAAEDKNGFDINRQVEELSKTRILNQPEGIRERKREIVMAVGDGYVPDILKNKDGTLKNSATLNAVDGTELSKLHQTLAEQLNINADGIKFVSNGPVVELVIHKNAVENIYGNMELLYRKAKPTHIGTEHHYKDVAERIAHSVEYEVSRSNKTYGRQQQEENPPPPPNNGNGNTKKPAASPPPPPKNDLSDLAVSREGRLVKFGKNLKNTVVSLPKDIGAIGKNLWKNKDESGIILGATGAKILSRVFIVASRTNILASVLVSTTTRGVLKNERVTKQKISEYRDRLVDKLNSSELKNNLVGQDDVFKNASWNKVAGDWKHDTYEMNIKESDKSRQDICNVLFAKKGLLGGFDANGNGRFTLSKKQFRQFAENITLRENGREIPLRNAIGIDRPAVVNTASLKERFSGKALSKGSGNFLFGTAEIVGAVRDEKSGKWSISADKLRNSILMISGLHTLGEGFNWLREHFSGGGHTVAVTVKNNAPHVKTEGVVTPHPVDTPKSLPPKEVIPAKVNVVRTDTVVNDHQHNGAPAPAKIDRTPGLPRSPMVEPRIDSTVSKHIDDYIAKSNSGGSKIDITAHSNLSSSQKISQIQLATKVLNVKVDGHEIAWNDKLTPQTEKAIMQIFKDKGIEIPNGYVCEANLDKIHAVIMEQSSEKTTKLQEILRDKFGEFNKDFTPTGNPGTRTLEALQHAAAKLKMEGPVHFDRTQEFIEKSTNYIPEPKISIISSQPLHNQGNINIK